MAKRNFENRTLYHGDNLKFLMEMNSGTIDLVATDPPFNKSKDFHATPDSLAKGAKFQDRWSWKKDVQQEWVDQITDDHPALKESIEAARAAHSDGMGAFCCFLAVRLLEMKRILKQTGSIYIHCDPTASHYIKTIMDAIFGRKNFINEIVWNYEKWTNAGNIFQRNHDLILFYGMPEYKFNKQYGERTQRQKSLMKAGYNLGSSNGVRLVRIYDKNNPNVVKKLSEWKAEGRAVYYVDEPEGKALSDVWDIPSLNGQAKERYGYPTQKPLALYERIIETSSDEGDVVLDPFCGCATTLVAAERLKRKWVGMDIWDEAKDAVIKRLSKEGKLNSDQLSSPETLFYWDKIIYETTPPERADNDIKEDRPVYQVPERFQEPGQKMGRQEMVEYLLKHNGPVCQGCDREFSDPRYLELDHNTPRSDGGLNHITNRVLLCGPCNRLKSNRFTLSGLRRENKKLGYMAD
ncbi:MAG: DNA methyltransferase [Candidatus Dadabacteria bacterium]|nr:DNA methyltransferase [Candidatus Dadabacteria bacterium]